MMRGGSPTNLYDEKIVNVESLGGYSWLKQNKLVIRPTICKPLTLL